MSKSPWGNMGAGAWAAEAERAEEEEREQAAQAAAQAASNPAKQMPGFPDLKDAIGTVKQSKKKTKMSLQELQRNFAVGLTPEEMIRLPTGPRERGPGDEMPYGSRIGGGFSNYGSRPSGPPPGRIRDGSEGNWGGARKSYGGIEDETRQNRGPRPDFDQTSRADEVDNWSTMKKPLPPSFSSGGPGGGGLGPRPSRYASLGGGSGGPSRADEVGDWGSTKKPIPPPATRNYAFGSGLRESRPESDRWTRDANPERQTLSLDISKGEDGGGVVKVNKPNPFGAARPREEVLAEKGLDWKKLDLDIDAKKVVSRPTSSQSSRPGSSHSNISEGQALQGTGEGLPKPKPKVNPFGEAKPREVLLEEKGLDWRKIDLDLDHRRVERVETDEEKKLKEEIEHLQNEMKQKSGEDLSSLKDLILKKEKDLELLIRDLDDKVRFGQKVTERPGSGAGRFSAPVERISSHPVGAYEDRRGGEFMERPRSRGNSDAWPRSVDDRRSSQRGRGRGYLGGRDMERSLSRERW